MTGSKKHSFLKRTTQLPVFQLLTHLTRLKFGLFLPYKYLQMVTPNDLRDSHTHCFLVRAQYDPSVSFHPVSGELSALVQGKCARMLTDVHMCIDNFAHVRALLAGVTLVPQVNFTWPRVKGKREGKFLF